MKRAVRAFREKPDACKGLRPGADRRGMNMTVPPQMRIVALVGLIALVGLALSVMLLSRNGGSPAADTVGAPDVRSAGRPETPARPSPTKPVGKVATPSKPQVPPAVTAAVKAGLPLGIARAFADKKVVVVALYSAVAPIDQLAFDEAAAGAERADAGFVAIDVVSGDDTVTRALATKLGILEAPTVLVFRRPGELTVRIDGFADHETVAQAASNAAAA